MLKIALIGCTGSIGRQTADVVRRYPDRFCFSALACANALYGAVRGRLFCSVTVPALVGLAVQFVSLVLIPARLEAVDFLVRELVFLILLLYFAALMFVAYFAASGEERQDLVKNYGSEGRF